MRSHQYALDTRNEINDDKVTFTSRKSYGDTSDIEASENEEEGLGDTSHISVLAANGDAVSVTTSVGY